MSGTFILGILLLASGASEPASTNSDNAPSQTAKVKEKKICRMGDSTGSRIAGKRCKTQTEWDKLEKTSESGDKSRSGMTLKP